LTTAAGEPLAKESVAIQMNGTTRTTVVTNANGRYEATVELPADAADSVVVRAGYDGSGTNLDSADATSMVSLPSEGSVPVPMLVGAVAVVGVIIAAGVVFVRRRDSPEPVPAPTAAQSDASQPVEPAQETVQSEARESLVARLDSASATVDEDPNGAVIKAYVHVRAAMVRDLDLPPVVTHDECYRAVASGRPEVEAPMRRLVDAFETAAFAEHSLDSVGAREAVDAAKALAADR
jgi:hypothetical protein